MSPEQEKRLCVHCGNPAPFAHNYCTDKCFRDAWDEAGGPLITPNGLPVRCYRASDNARMEHEHADHPDYKFPVTVDYIGEVSSHDRETYTGFFSENEEVTDDKIRLMLGEYHALIYADDNIAITLYEHCYAMWHLADGHCAGGDLWATTRKAWCLNEISRQHILEFVKNGKRPEFEKLEKRDQGQSEGTSGSSKDNL